MNPIRADHLQGQRRGGFTLVELLTAVAVAAILLGIGVPSFYQFVVEARATTEYRQLVKAFGVARSEAVTRGTAVKISAVSGSDWHEGFRIWVDEDGDDDYDAGEAIREMAALASDATLSAGTSSFTYDREGFLEAVPGSQFVIAYRTDPERCEWDRDIRITYTGHVSVQERACD